MNPDRLIQMLIRMFMNKGINKGIDHMSRKGKQQKDMTPEEREQAKSSRNNMQNTKRGMNTIRRLFRF